MMDKSSRLKVALQKSGRLTDNSLDLLVRCGLKYSRGKDQLMCYGENMPLDVLFVRDDDIPDLVQQDVCDLGIVGLNVIEEKRLAFKARGIAPLFEQLMVLDFGKCRLSIAVPDGVEYRGIASLHGKRIATTYPNILARYLRQNDVQAEIVTRTKKYNVVLEERVNFGQQVQSSNSAWNSFNKDKDALSKLLDDIEGRRLQDNP